MGMQTDVRGITVTGDSTLSPERTRLKGGLIAPTANTAATVIFYSSPTGTYDENAEILVNFNVASSPSVTPFSIIIPGEGIIAKDGLYVTISTGSVTGVTVFYG